MRTPCSLIACRAGSAAAEMALVLPLMLLLLFGAFELGYYFMSEHVVQKGVRDAARYASRLPITGYDCSVSPATVDATTEEKIQRVARTGNPEAGGTSRLFGWTQDSMTDVSLTCDTSGTYGGLYTGYASGVPVVTVASSVPYPMLFGILGLRGADAGSCEDPTAGGLCLRLNARSQAAMFGA